MKQTNIILAIETAVAGGSLSLLKNRLEVGSWDGNYPRSKSDSILDEINELLTKHNLKKSQIDLFVIPKDIGSVTGSRIGEALARGLSKSLNRPYVEVSVLKSLLIYRNKNGKILTAVQINEKEVFYQIFIVGNDANYKILESANKCNTEIFNDIKSQTHFDNIIFFKASDNNLDLSLSVRYKDVIIVRETLAKSIGLFLDELLKLRNYKQEI